MCHEICSGSLMLPLVGGTRIDANTGNPLFMCTMDIMKTITHHHGIIDGCTKLRHGITNRLCLGITTRLQPTHNGIKGRKIERINHLACRRLEARRRDGNLPPLPMESSNQLAHAGKDRVIIRRHLLVEQPTENDGDALSLLEGFMTEVGKAVEERRANQAAKVAFRLLWIAALEQRSVRTTQDIRAGIGNRSIKVQEYRTVISKGSRFLAHHSTRLSIESKRCPS